MVVTLTNHEKEILRLAISTTIEKEHQNLNRMPADMGRDRSVIRERERFLSDLDRLRKRLRAG